jgi:hypothetical protein
LRARSHGKAHGANSFLVVIIQFNHRQISFIIIMPGSGKENKTDGKSINQSPEKFPGKGDKKSKRCRKAVVSAWTPSTASSSSLSTPTSNLSGASSKLLTSNGSFSNTVRTLVLDDFSTTPSSQVKTPSKGKKSAYAVNFCDSSDTLAECLKYFTNPNNMPIDQESQLRFLLDQYKTNDIQTAFCQLIGNVGGLATTAFHPLPI